MMSDLISDAFHVMFGSPCNITTGLGGTMDIDGVIDFSLRRFTYQGGVQSKGLGLSGKGLLGLSKGTEVGYTLVGWFYQWWLWPWWPVLVLGFCILGFFSYRAFVFLICWKFFVDT